MPTRTRLVALMLGCTALCWGVSTPLVAEAAEKGRKGHGSVTVSYQYIHTDGFESEAGFSDIGETDTHTVNFEVDYHVSERWTLSAGIPLITKRYKGNFPHLKSIFTPEPDTEFIDDGDYHTDFQDLHLGVHYLLTTNPIVIEPYVSTGIPSNDYPFYGNAAVGFSLWRVDVGSAFAYFPPLSDVFYQLDVAYTFEEKTLGTNKDHWRVAAEVGYFFSPRVTGRVFAFLKKGNGLVFPDDFPPPRDDNFWYHHDQMIKHDYAIAGATFDYSLNPRYRLSLSWIEMIGTDNIHKMRDAVNFSVARSF